MSELELTTEEWQQAILSRLDYQSELLLVLVFAVACVAASGSFQVILYAARNKNFWGAVAFCLVSLQVDAQAGCIGNDCFENIVVTNSFCSGDLWLTEGTYTLTRFGTSYAGWSWRVAVFDATGAFSSCVVWSPFNPGGVTISFANASQAGFWDARVANPGNCNVPCDPVDGASVGLNCCPPGEFGATWYIAIDGDGCEYLACNSGACHGCGPPNPGWPAEGSPCECEEGQTGGVVVYTYDGNGCPNGYFCDSCEECPPLSPEQLELLGTPCEAGGMSGYYLDRVGADGCPEIYCDVEIPVCVLDSNRDGVPDYLEGNPYAGMEVGAECVCEGGKPGKIKIETNQDGCEVPICDCSGEEECEDKDNDECCDDEDPDPNDPDVKCDDCDLTLGNRVGNLITALVNKIDLPSASYSEASDEWTFEFDSAAPIPGVVVFGLRFGGDLTNGTFWYDNPGSSSSWDSVFGEFYGYRPALRGLLACGVYLSFFYGILGAAFHPGR